MILSLSLLAGSACVHAAQGAVVCLRILLACGQLAIHQDLKGHFVMCISYSSPF